MKFPDSALCLFDAAALERTLQRMAHEILEKHTDLSLVALVGIPSRGVELASRLGGMMRTLASGSSQNEGSVPFCGAVDVSMHRDDLHVRWAVPAVQPTRLPDSLEGKTVILVDDVLQSGRTCRAAMDAISSFGRPERIEYAVLVDRGLRELPIGADYVGRKLETVQGERVFVRLAPIDDKEGVWLERVEGLVNK